MKKITSLLLMLLFAVTAANAKYTYWGYAGKTAADLPYGSIGTRQGKAAIYIPAEVAQMYKGLKVTGLRFSLTDKAETVKAFVAEDLNGAYATEKMADMGNKGLNSVLFDEAYTITGEPFYLGYEYTSDINVVGVTDEYCEGANFTDFGSGWTDNAKLTPDNAPALALQMRVEGTEIPVDVAICGVKKVITAVGDTYQIKGKLLNFAAAKITSLRFGYTIGNEPEQFADIEQTVAARAEEEFAITCNAPEEKGSAILKVRLVEVNGKEDAYAANNTYVSTIVTANVQMTKRVYMEEYTGIKCPWCVRGIEEISQNHTKFPGQFVAMAKHCYSGTPTELQCSSYTYSTGNGFPRGTYDRRRTNGLDTTDKNELYVKAFINSGSVLGIDAIANFTDADHSKVTATAVMKFNRELPNANYGLAFAVIENDVKGYKQKNAYAGSVKSYYGWEKKGGLVALDLQHVARLGYETVNGISDVFPKQINSGDAFSHTIELNLPKNIQNYKNLKLIAFVIDRNSKYVENVVEVPIKEMQPTETAIRDINNVETPAITFLNGYIDALNFDGKISVYTVDGKAVANTNLKPGMYIVRLTKGKQTFVKKIVL